MQACFLRSAAAAGCAALVLALVGCGTTPSTAGRSGRPIAPGRDGPDARPPADLDKVPDAEPKVETIRSGGPNKPYEVLGKRYVPMTEDKPYVERGLASWYGRKFQGHSTASGETYNMYAMTAASPTLPIPSYARVRNPANGREVIVRINDRGPFHSGRIIDLSYTAALKLDLLRGVAPVEVERITYDDIRTGAWKRDTTQPDATMEARVQPAPASPAAATPAAALPATVAPPVPEVLQAAVAAADASPSTTPLPTPVPTAKVPPGPPDAAAGASNAPAPALAASQPAGEAPSASSDVPPVASASQPQRAFTAAARGFWVQLGAFKQQAGAVDFERRVQGELDWLAPLLAIFKDHQVHRLQAGPYRTRSDAQSAAERIRAALQLVPVIVERR